MQDTPVLDSPSTVGDTSDAFRIQPAFGLEDACRQGLGGAPVEHRHRGLADDGAGVEFGGDEVDSRAGDLHTVREGLMLGLEPRESRDIQPGIGDFVR